MPNHCYNVLKLTDNPSKTKETLKSYIKKEDGEEVFDFNKVIKMPEELNITSTNPDTKTKEGRELKKQQDENIKNHGFKDWYDWSVANWGTKWNSYENYMGEDSISFQTAWSPPIPVIVKLAEKTKKSWTLMYSEIGCDFCGKLVVDETGVTHDDQWSHKKAPRTFKNEMGITEDMYMSEEELEKRKKKKMEKRVKKAMAKKGSDKTIAIDMGE
jgi:hypothetical protein